MQETINEKVSVITLYDRDTRVYKPLKVKWGGRVYVISEWGYRHNRREGRAMIHVFSVSTPTLFMCLELNTETLDWTLKEISDGNAA